VQPRYIEESNTLNPGQILGIVRKYLRLIVLTPIIATLIAGGIVYYLLVPVYGAETTLLVRNQAAGQIVYNDILMNRQLVKTYREIARSRTVAEEVIGDASLQISVDKLRSMVDVTLRGDTEIIVITVESTDPAYAARLANAVANSFISNTLRIMQLENITVVDFAIAPDTPIRPRKVLIMMAAGFAGGMLGLTSAFVLAYLDNTFKSAEDVQDQLGLPVLGTIPVFRLADFVHNQDQGG
jgi:capsular polysaccharide biosynthesis protein